MKTLYVLVSAFTVLTAQHHSFANNTIDLTPDIETKKHGPCINDLFLGKRGPTGRIGPTGPTGPAGGQGIQGLTGPTGQEGKIGNQGLAGPTGPAGGQGIQGLAGPTGPAGEQGIQGLAGPTGPAGVQGIQGLAGPTGPAGGQGIQGIIGPTGATGATGPGIGCKGSFQLPDIIAQGITISASNNSAFLSYPNTYINQCITTATDTQNGTIFTITQSGTYLINWSTLYNFQGFPFGSNAQIAVGLFFTPALPFNTIRSIITVGSQNTFFAGTLNGSSTVPLVAGQTVQLRAQAIFFDANDSSNVTGSMISFIRIGD